MNDSTAAIGLRAGAYTWVSAAITVGLFWPCWVLELHPFTWMMAMFYGPLIASYQSRHNVVWRCALGGLAGMTTVIVVAIVMEWAAVKSLFHSVGGMPRREDIGDSEEVTWRFVLAVPLLFASVFPFCLVGSSVGEHLSVWRRKRELDPPPMEQVTPRKMTDEEIARTKL